MCGDIKCDIGQTTKLEISNLKYGCKLYGPFVFVIGSDNGESFLAKTCSIILIKYNVVLTDGNIQFHNFVIYLNVNGIQRSLDW